MEDCEIGTNGKAVANRNERQTTAWGAVLVLIYLPPRKRHFPKITVFNAEVRYSGEINGLRQSSSGALGNGHLVGGRGGLIDSDGVGLYSPAGVSGMGEVTPPHQVLRMPDIVNAWCCCEIYEKSVARIRELYLGCLLRCALVS